MQILFLRLLYYLIIAFVIGTVAQILTGYNKRRTLTTLILGFVGVVAGDVASAKLHLPLIIYPVFGISIVWSIVGAVIVILIYRLFRG
ncbi:MAG: hypothetical protein ABIC40_02610, partial [bacterium]